MLYLGLYANRNIHDFKKRSTKYIPKDNDKIIFNLDNEVVKVIYLFAIFAARTYDFLGFEIGDFKHYGEYNLQQLIYSSRSIIPLSSIDKHPISDDKNREYLNYSLERWRKTTHIIRQIESVLCDKIPEITERKLSPTKVSIILPFLWRACFENKNIFHSALDEILKTTKISDFDTNDEVTKSWLIAANFTIIEQPLVIKKKLYAYIKRKFPEYEFLPEVKESIENFLATSRNLKVEGDIFSFLSNNFPNFIGIILPHRILGEILVSGHFLWNQYWTGIEIINTEARDLYPSYVKNFNTSENKILDCYQNLIEEEDWRILKESGLLPKGYWMSNISKNEFKNSRQIDFIGIFFRKRWFICIGEIKSIKGDHTIVEHFKQLYYSKFDEACSQLNRSEREMKKHFSLFKQFLLRKKDFPYKNQISQLDHKNIIKAVVPLPGGVFKPSDNTVWTINSPLQKKHFLKELDFIIAINLGEITINDDLIHLFEWKEEKWHEIFSIGAPKDILNKMGITNFNNMMTNTVKNSLKDFKYRIFKRY